VSQILKQSGTTLRCPVTFADPVTTRQMTKDLIPDALFGLQYHTPDGDRFRFFAVEADRATEPTTTTNWNRKSFLHNLLQYGAYVSGGAFAAHGAIVGAECSVRPAADETNVGVCGEVIPERE
jgi:hypothetical protein